MKKYIAEFIGTFILVFCGTGAIMINEVSSGAVSHIGIALTFGLAVMIVIYSIGKVSGAHINPAVSIVLWTNKELALVELAKYIISQIAGALLASILLKFLFPSSELLGTTLPAGTATQSFILEVLLSFILMFVIQQTSANPTVLNGLVIGSVVGLEALFAGPITGASMNPARSLAPAFVSGHTEFLWIYLLAPVIGMYLGNIVSKSLFTKTA